MSFIFSLCDGMGYGQIALTELGIKINHYHASEIDKNSIKCTQDNYARILIRKKVGV